MLALPPETCIFKRGYQREGNVWHTRRVFNNEKLRNERESGDFRGCGSHSWECCQFSYLRMVNRVRSIFAEYLEDPSLKDELWKGHERSNRFGFSEQESWKPSWSQEEQKKATERRVSEIQTCVWWAQTILKSVSTFWNLFSEGIVGEYLVLSTSLPFKIVFYIQKANCEQVNIGPQLVFQYFFPGN